MSWKLNNPRVIGRDTKSDDVDTVVDAKDYKDLVENNEDLSNIALRKAFTSEVKVPTDGADDRTVEFIISSTRRDRDGDIIDPKGWQLKDYKNNPVVLWGHNPHQPPIGRAKSVWLDGDKLMAKAEFADNEADPSGFADTIYRMLKAGYLNATSVGFLPHEFEFIKDKDEDGDIYVTGLKFTKQDLMEFSVVSVPSNADALVTDKSVGDIKPYKQFLEKALDEYESYKDTLLVPKDKAFEVYKTITKNSKESKGNDMKVDKRVITYNAAHEDGTPKAPKDTEWDGPEEVSKAEVDDLYMMSAYVKETDDEPNKEDFKLPHHTADNKSVVWRGVTAAMASLMGARGGVDVPEDERRGIYDHLAKHYREFDEEAPEFKNVEDQVLSKEDYEMNEKGQVVEVEKQESEEDVDTLIKESEEILEKDTKPKEDTESYNVEYHSVTIKLGDVEVTFDSSDKDAVLEFYEKQMGKLEPKAKEQEEVEHKEEDSVKPQEETKTKGVGDEEVNDDEVEEDEVDLEELKDLLPGIIDKVVTNKLNEIQGKVS